MFRIRQRPLPPCRGLLAALAASTFACAAHGGGPSAAPYTPGNAALGSEWGAPDPGADEPWPEADAGNAELDHEEELQQLLAEAGAALSSGSVGDAATQEELGRAVEELQRALQDKARRLEEEGPEAAAAAEAAVSASADRLRAALEGARAFAAGGDSGAGGGFSADPPRPGALERVTALLDSAVQVMTRIQELRAAFHGLRQDDGWSSAGAGSGGGVLEDVPLQDVSGVVTQDGEPVAGAVVAEPSLHLSTTTGADGSYTLPGVPSRLTRLVVSRQGRPIGEGVVSVARGRSAIADFQLGRTAGSRAPRAAILPSNVSLPGQARPGGAGTVEGVVEDAAGRPVARTLVRLQGLGAARTDSHGRYAFRNVPPGTQVLTVARAGAGATTERLSVSAAQVTRLRTRLDAATGQAAARGHIVDKNARTRKRPVPPRPGPRSGVTACVSDERNGRALEGASVVLSGGASASRTGRTGKDGCESFPAAPGALRVRATRAGYGADEDSLKLGAGQHPTVRLRLRPLARADADRRAGDRERLKAPPDRHGGAPSRSGARSEPAGRGATKGTKTTKKKERAS